MPARLAWQRAWARYVPAASCRRLERKGDDFASEAVGAQLLAASVAAIISAPLQPAGAPLWLRPAALPLAALLIGEVTLRDVSAAGLPAWHSLLVQTAPARPLCNATPDNALVLQSLGESVTQSTWSSTAHPCNCVARWSYVLPRRRRSSSRWKGRRVCWRAARRARYVAGCSWMCPTARGTLPRRVGRRAKFVPWSMPPSPACRSALFERPLALATAGHCHDLRRR